MTKNISLDKKTILLFEMSQFQNFHLGYKKLFISLINETYLDSRVDETDLASILDELVTEGFCSRYDFSQFPFSYFEFVPFFKMKVYVHYGISTKHAASVFDKYFNEVSIRYYNRFLDTQNESSGQLGLVEFERANLEKFIKIQNCREEPLLKPYLFLDDYYEYTFNPVQREKLASNTLKLFNVNQEMNEDRWEEYYSILNNYLALLSERFEYNKACVILKEGIELLDNLNWVPPTILKPTLLTNLGTMYIYINDLTAARKYLKEAEELAKNEDDDLITTIWQSYSRLEMELDNSFSTSLYYDRLIVDYWREKGDKLELAAALVSIAIVGDLNAEILELDPENYFDEAERIYKELEEDFFLGDTYNAKGHYLLNIDRVDEAYNLFDKALSLAISENNPIRKANGFHYLGEAENARGNYGKAFSYYEMALKEFKELESPDPVGDMYMEMGDLRYNEGKLNGAMHYFEKAIRIYKQTKNKSKLALLYILYADVCKDLDKGELGETVLQKSLILAKELQDDYLIGMTKKGIKGYKKLI